MALFLFYGKGGEKTMKKLTILVVVMSIAVLLAGCGITTPEPVINEIETDVDSKGLYGVYDLTGYNSTIVNNGMASYNTPAKIVNWMKNNVWKVEQHTVAFSPEEFYTRRWGDCNDFSTYGIYCAYKCAGMPKSSLYQVYLKYDNGKYHMLALYALYPTFPEFNYGYSSNKYYYHDASFYNWVECVKHHDTKTTANVVWAKFYSYDLDFMQTWYF